MCKYQSGGMSNSTTNSNSDLNQNNVFVDCSTSSAENHVAECKTERCNPINNGSPKENINFYVKEMAVGSHVDSSSSEKVYDTKQIEIQDTNQQIGNNSNEEKAFKNCENPDFECPDYEDYISENSPMLQNQELFPYILSTSSSLENYNLPLVTLEGCNRSYRSGSFPGIHSWTAASKHSSKQNTDCTVECDINSVNSYLKVKDELEPLFRPPYSCVVPISDNISIDTSSDNTSHYSPMRSSLVQNLLFPKQLVLDEVHVHKNYSSKVNDPLYTSSFDNCANFQLESKLLNESQKKRSNSDLSIMLSMKTPRESCSDTLILRRRSSIHWEVSSISSSDNDINYRSLSVSPIVNFAMLETDSSSDTGGLPYSIASFQENNGYVLPEKQLPEVAVHPAMLPSSISAIRLSSASSFSDCSPVCKICHMVAREEDPLISPCRCSGTMQFIHCGCLMKWLEISSKRSRKPPSCELCQYQYQWHKKFKVRHWQFPRCSRKDVTFHLVFFLSVLVMIACATVTILCFKQDKGTKIDPDRTELTHSEITTLICGIMFFLAFFLGMYVEIKARNTIYKLLVKFIYLNQQWYIDEYIKKESITASV